MKNLTRKEEYAAATRRALLDAALEEFDKKGYSRTSIEDIVQAARVTRGALYHHFESKEEIFTLVYKELVEQLVKAIRHAIKDIDDPWEKALAGCKSYLDFCVEPAFKNVCLNDAIGVMGWKKWRDISSDYTMDLLKELLAGLTAPGKKSVHSLDHVANLLYSILVEAVMTIMNSPDKEKARADVSFIIQRMLLGLRS